MSLRSGFAIVVGLVACVLAAAGVPAARAAPDVVFGAVTKEARYVQTSTGSPVPDTTNGDLPLRLSASVFPTTVAPDTITASSFQGPSLGLTALQPPDATHRDWRSNDKFATQAALDAAHPNGTYPLTVNTLHDGNFTFSPVVTGDAYPAAPHLTNFAALQAINPSTSTIVTWDAMSNGTGNDFILLQVSDSSGNNVLFSTAFPGQPGALTGAATSASIGAGVLQPGQPYLVEVLFAKVGSSDPSTYPGVPVLGGYVADTFAPAATVPEPAAGLLLGMGSFGLMARRRRRACIFGHARLRQPIPEAQRRRNAMEILAKQAAGHGAIATPEARHAQANGEAAKHPREDSNL